MLSKIRQYFELIKYCFFGGITTLLNLALLYVFVEMGMNYIVANTIAYIIAVVVNYVFSVFFVFEEKAEGVKQNIVQFGKFCSVRTGPWFWIMHCFSCVCPFWERRSGQAESYCRRRLL